MGYAIASIGYRLSDSAVFPAQIQDVKAAVRWLRAHAKEGRDGVICGAERRAACEACWQNELATVLAESGKSPADILGDTKSAPWKIAAAVRLRLRTGAQHRWIAEALNMGCAASVRIYVSRKINL